jgi:hypothetical protein
MGDIKIHSVKLKICQHSKDLGVDGTIIKWRLQSGLDNGGGCLIPGRGNISFSSPNHPNLLCGSPSLLFRDYKDIFLEVKTVGGVKLSTHLHLEQLPSCSIKGEAFEGRNVVTDTLS